MPLLPQPTAKQKPMDASAFIRELVNEVPKFDEMIMKDIRLADRWIGNVRTGSPYTRWQRIKMWLAVKLLILSAFCANLGKRLDVPSSDPVGSPVEITQDRFRSVWPNTTAKWERVKPKKKKRRKNKCP